MEKKSLIITGGSSGIGETTAALFLSHGWQVINLSRKPCPVKQVINVSVDLSSNAQIGALQRNFDQHLSEKQKICLVHNAAFHNRDNITSVLEEALTQAFNVNMLAPLMLNKLLLPKMLPSSSIIYMGSTLSEKAVPNAASYSIIKHAIVGMMRATTQDLADLKIYSACICPGFTDTPMLRQHLNNNETIIQQVTDFVCMKRLVEPDEIAELILFSANNPVINGAVIHGNLGQIER